MERLFLTSPSYRRNFIDRFIFSKNKSYNNLINKYKKNILERNKLLISKFYDEVWLRKLEEERKDMLEEIQENDTEFKNIEKDCKDLESECKVNQKELKKYTEMLGDLEDSITDSSQTVSKKRESLEEIRKNEVRLQCNLVSLGQLGESNRSFNFLNCRRRKDRKIV